MCRGSRQVTQVPIADFWNTRIALSGILQSRGPIQQIPHVPDQGNFLAQWFDWHRGYSIITLPDGSQVRQELKGESLAEVPLGHLPRTLAQLQPAGDRPIRIRPSYRRRQPQRGIASETSPLLSPTTLNTVAANHTRHNPNGETRHHVPSLSMTSSQPNVAPGVDAEDSIFDDSSSESSNQSDLEDPQESFEGSDSDNSHIAALRSPEDLVPNLQQNVDALSGMIAEVTRRSALRRATLQLSSVSNQIASITQQLTSTWQSNRDNLQNQPTGQAMDSTPNQNGDSSIPPSSTSRISRHIGHQVSQSQSEQNPQYQYLPAPPAYLDAAIEDSDSLSNSETSSLHSRDFVRIVHTSSRRAQREQRRRQEAAPVFGTREEVERLGTAYQSPLASLFEQQSPTPVDHADSTDRQQQSLGNGTGSASNQGDELNTAGPDVHAPDGSLLHHSTAHLRLMTDFLDLGVADEDLIDFTAPASNQPHRVRPSTASVNHNAESPRVWRSTEHYGYPHMVPPPYLLDYPRLDPGLASPTGAADGPNHGQSPNAQTFADYREPRPVPVPLSRESRTLNSFPDWSPAPPSSFYRTTTQQHQAAWGQQMPVDMSQYDYLRTSAEALHRHERMTQVLARRVRQPAAPRPQPSLDTDTTRPEPVAEEAKMIKMECKICFSQISNQVVLPCGKSSRLICLP